MMAGYETVDRHNQKPDPPRPSHPGELLFEFRRGLDVVRCELRDHGDYGWEAQFVHAGELLIGRMFRQRLDPTRTPREMAIAWAVEERKAIKKGGA